jgi:hypothetical protein
MAVTTRASLLTGIPRSTKQRQVGQTGVTVCTGWRPVPEPATCLVPTYRGSSIRKNNYLLSIDNLQAWLDTP